MNVKVLVTRHDDTVDEYIGKKASWTGKVVKLYLADGNMIQISGDSYKKISIKNYSGE